MLVPYYTQKCLIKVFDQFQELTNQISNCLFIYIVSYTAYGRNDNEHAFYP